MATARAYYIDSMLKIKNQRSQVILSAFLREPLPFVVEIQTPP